MSLKSLKEYGNVMHNKTYALFFSDLSKAINLANIH